MGKRRSREQKQKMEASASCSKPMAVSNPSRAKPMQNLQRKPYARGMTTACPSGDGVAAELSQRSHYARGMATTYAPGVLYQE